MFGKCWTSKLWCIEDQVELKLLNLNRIMCWTSNWCVEPQDSHKNCLTSGKRSESSKLRNCDVMNIKSHFSAIPKSSDVLNMSESQLNFQKVLNLKFVMFWNLIDIKSVELQQNYVLNPRSTFKMFNFKSLYCASGNRSKIADPKNCDMLNLWLTFKVLNLYWVACWT